MSLQDSWQDWYKQVEKDIEPDVKLLQRRLNEEDHHHILDIGCGAGRHFLYLAKHGFNMEGFDLSEKAVSNLEEQINRFDLEGNVTVHNMENPFPYEDERFDAAMAIRSIHHATMSTVNHVVRETYRVLEPSGLLYTQIPTYEKLERLVEEGEQFEELEPGTSIPLDGPEKGIPHHNFTEEEVLDVFSPFQSEHFYKQQDHYRLLARKPI